MQIYFYESTTTNILGVLLSTSHPLFLEPPRPVYVLACALAPLMLALVRVRARFGE